MDQIKTNISLNPTHACSVAKSLLHFALLRLAHFMECSRDYPTFDSTAELEKYIDSIHEFKSALSDLANVLQAIKHERMQEDDNVNN